MPTEMATGARRLLNVQHRLLVSERAPRTGARANRLSGAWDRPGSAASERNRSWVWRDCLHRRCRRLRPRPSPAVCHPVPGRHRVASVEQRPVAAQLSGQQQVERPPQVPTKRLSPVPWWTLPSWTLMSSV